MLCLVDVPTIIELHLNINPRKLKTNHEDHDRLQFYHMLLWFIIWALIGIGKNSKGGNDFTGMSGRRDYECYLMPF